MRVLVTGHKGYIGAVMVPMLQKAGHDVVGLDSDLYRNSTYGGALPEVPEIIKDIRDVEKSDLEGVEAIIHLAGLSNDMLGDLNPELTYQINYAASTRLAAMAKELGITRFVFASSCSNYGAAGDGMQDESAPNFFVPLGDAIVEKKIRHLMEFFPTQRERRWFDEQTFRALLRLRGVEAGVRYAEAFYCRKIAL